MTLLVCCEAGNFLGFFCQGARGLHLKSDGSSKQVCFSSIKQLAIMNIRMQCSFLLGKIIVIYDLKLGTVYADEMT